MPTTPPFSPLQPPRRLVPVRFDGVERMLPDGMNLAAALLTAGVSAFRKTPVSGSPRGPFCMMGACFDCLVKIDGVTRQACMLRVRAGLDIAPAHRGRTDG